MGDSTDEKHTFYESRPTLLKESKSTKFNPMGTFSFAKKIFSNRRGLQPFLVEISISTDCFSHHSLSI